MKIVVFMKQTLATEEKIVLTDDGQVNEDGVEWVINPYDEFAIEEALKVKETHGGEVTAITIGPSRAESALRTALAMGVDQAIHVCDPALFGDEFTIAKAAAAVLNQMGYDLILTGNMSVDNGAAQFGPRLAEELGIPHITAVIKLEIDGHTVKAERDAEGDVEVIESTLPILITAQQGLNEPRYPSLPGIMKAKKKPISRLSAADLGIDPELVKAKTQTVARRLPAKKAAGRLITGDSRTQVEQLIDLLRHEAHVL